MANTFKFKSLQSKSIAGGAGTFTTLTATPASGSALTLTGGTVTASAPLIDASQTWNNAAVTFTGVRFNINNTASGSSSVPFDVQIDGSPRIRLRRDSTVELGEGVAGIRLGGYTIQGMGGGMSIRSASGNTGFNLDSGGITTLNCSVFEQRTGATAQTFRLYTTIGGTGNVDFERFFIRGQTGNSFLIGTEKGGTGSARPLEFQTDGVTRMRLTIDGTTQLTGSLQLSNQTNYSLISGGAFSGLTLFDGNNRVSLHYGGITIRSDSYYGWASSGNSAVSPDTTIRRVSAGLLQINAEYSAEYRDLVLRALMVGGTTASFPALRNSSTTLQVRLANNSDFAPLAAGLITATGNLVLTDNDGAQTATFDAQSKLTANRTYDLPDASGTLALTSDFAAPPSIGSTTANAGTFTTLAANNGTLTASAPVLDLSQTWNNSGVTFTGMRFNATDTASATASVLADFQVGGTSFLSVRKDGVVRFRTGNLNITAFQIGNVTVGTAGGGSELNVNMNFSAGSFLSNAGVLSLRLANGQSPVFLARDDGDIFAQRNGANAQTFRIYGQLTGTDVSATGNYERGFMRWSAAGGTFQIGTEKGTGGGSARALEFQTDGVTRMTIAATGGNINMGTSAVFGTTGLQFDSAASFRFSSGSIGSSSDLWILRSGSGIMRISTGSGDNDFNRLQFGGTTSSYPALKRSSTTLQVRLADDSAFAPLEASNMTATGDVIANRIQATVKNFHIKHPTKPDKHLVYSSLETPYNGVQLTGEAELVHGECIVQLPDYLHGLIHANNVHIQLTNHKHSKVLYVDSVDIQHNRFTVKCNSWASKFKTFKFFWLLNGVRKDIELLQTEV